MSAFDKGLQCYKITKELLGSWVFFLGGGGQIHNLVTRLIHLSNCLTHMAGEIKNNILHILPIWDIRYSQKETPRLFSWEFSRNQLAHRESIACNWL